MSVSRVSVDSPSPSPIVGVTVPRAPYDMHHVSTAAEWSARIADAADEPAITNASQDMGQYQAQTQPHDNSHPHQTKWQMNAQQLDWLLSEAEQYMAAAQ